MQVTDMITDTMSKFEEDSAVLKGLRGLANDKGYVTVSEALEATPARESDQD